MFTWGQHVRQNTPLQASVTCDEMPRHGAAVLPDKVQLQHVVMLGPMIICVEAGGTSISGF